LKNGGAEASKQTFKIGRLLKHSGSFQLSVKKLLVSHYDAAHFKKCLPLFHPIWSKTNTIVIGLRMLTCITCSYRYLPRVLIGSLVVMTLATTLNSKWLEYLTNKLFY